MHFGTKNYLKSNRNHIAKFSLILKKLHFRKYYKIILENSLNNLNLFCWTNLWQLLGFFSSVLQINDLEGLIIPLLLLIQSKNSSCGWWFSNYNFIISAFCLLFFLAVAYYKMKGELVLLTKVLLFMPETNKKNVLNTSILLYTIELTFCISTNLKLWQKVQYKLLLK
jgi:hypothetical protein